MQRYIVKKTCYAMIAAVLVCVSLLTWKIWSILTLEMKFYSLVVAQTEADIRAVSRCKLYIHSALGSMKAEGEHCPAGTVTKNKHCASCPQGTFSFEGWMSCARQLSCEQIKYDVQATKNLYDSRHWKYKAAEWNGYQLLYAEAQKRVDLVPEIIREITRNNSVLHLVGFCRELGIIVFTTRSEISGPANELKSLLIRSPECDIWIIRFSLVMNFIETLARLHSSPSGPIVLCNSFSLEQTLIHFAITEQWTLILVAFDNLQQRKNGSLIKCSDDELKGNFVAPEQRWPYPGIKVFNVQLQPGYTEASDLWKIPDVTRALLGSSTKAQQTMEYLSLIHFRCKSNDPSSRPSAAEVLAKYKNAWDFLVRF